LVALMKRPVLTLFVGGEFVVCCVVVRSCGHY
jgi:hypothetical protein